MLASAMAMTIYGGECKPIDISELENPLDIRYIVISNSSDMSGMNVTNNNTHINVCFKINYKPDNFTLVFFDKVTERIIDTVYTGGGGSSTKYIDKNVTVYNPIYFNRTVESEPIINEVEVIKYQTDNSIIIGKYVCIFIIGLVFGIIAILTTRSIRGKSKE